MTAFCGLYITTDCGGQMGTLQDGVFNGRPQYIFTFTFNGNIINGRIYWNPDEGRWYVEDATSGQNISYLPFDRPHPDGTVYEWENVSLLSYGCLSNSNSFQTDWFEFCPPTYFEFCCTGPIESDNFIGVQSFEYYGYYGTTFYLESPQFSGCATLIDSSIPLESIIYSSVDTSVEYNSCIDCTLVSGPCYTQPVYTTPTPIPVLTADTGCGVNYVLVNECQVLTVQPLSVLCLVTNVTIYGGNDGSIELIISGGTPPYTISWSNGFSTPIINNLISQVYNYTVTDYYGDFIVSNGCVVGQVPLPTPIPPLTNMCMTIRIDGEVFRITLQVYESDSGGKPGYSGEGYDIIWNSDYDIPYWSIEGPIVAGDMVNYNPNYPPLTGWVWLIQNTTGSAEGTLGDCQNSGNFCMTINVNSFATQPYRIFFNEYGISDGKPSWVDNLSQYELYWNENPPNSSWVVEGLPDYATFTISNSNPSVPPTNQWFVNGKSGEIEVKYENCFNSTICATISSLCETTNIELISGELINGQQSWYGQLPCDVDGIWSIYYDNTNDVWITDGLTAVPNAPIESTNINNVYTGPFGDFNTNGFYGLFVSDGDCNSQGNLKINATYNNPISDSDGGIILEVEGGNPPYQYSIDNGTTYFNFPIFSNLKFGTYVVLVRDVNGLKITQSVKLLRPPQMVVYQVSLNTTSRRTVNTVTTTTIEYTTKLNITPPLPSGVTISYNITHNDVYKVSPTESASSLVIGTVLNKNGNEILINQSSSDSYTYTNLLVSCQNNLVYVTATTEDWYNLTTTIGDKTEITTTVTNIKNGKSPCFITENNESYSLSNLRINGCSNCAVTNQDSPSPVRPTPTPSPTKPTVTPTGT